jgi:signal transduction histidine kinase
VAATDGVVRGAAIVIEVLDAAAEPRSAAAQWVFTIAHEIRTPLTIIKASLQALHELSARAALASEAERCLGRTERAADTIERLVTDLTDAARIEAHGFAIHKQPVDVAAMVRELADRVIPAAAGAHFRVDATAPAPPTPADPERLEQVLANLFSNAIKYGVRGGEIAVTVDRRAEETRVSVTNLGPGIPEDEQPRLFSRFFRARNAARAPGTGLGLYICKGIVEAHGGKMGVETRAEGPTRFWLTLPDTA